MTDETVVVEKRGPGRPPKQDFDEITYIPLDPGDPSETVWNGVKFPANKPVQVAKTRTVLVPIRHESANADGHMVSKSPERKVPMVTLAKDNPYFSVNGEPPPVREQSKPRIISDPDTYRGECYRWMAAETNLHAFEARWAAEAQLREDIGVDQDDLVRIMPSYEYHRLRLQQS